MIRVSVRDGKPLCPDCFEPMHEIRDGVWECPVTTALSNALARMMASAIDRAFDPGGAA